MITLFYTNRKAQNRHLEQLDMARAEGRMDRAADRNDRLREEIAKLLEERQATENAAYKLADAFAGFQNAQEAGEAPNHRFTEAQKLREKHTPQLQKVESIAIRTALLTNDKTVQTLLAEVRTVAQMWKDLVDNDPYEKFVEIRDRTRSAFEGLEEETRRIVTSDGRL
ncbi:hypothetical protein HZU40_22415 [Mycolicibacterium fluoranthenivorans]|uniref:Uncharacterized protein n=1 Tax=Mycolicibacterium fluoranthenivorans TaxID=258505 RepID=A0A7G8P9F5_9MYCO|nr:hypothetical protein [Mycolicibacterium fluoranthenivorans]QNJ90971.1 hypothetical protein HZU40_22415 [Mycolicibacterium fluoranthenivorans]